MVYHMMVWEQDYLCTAQSLCTCSSMHMQLYAHVALVQFSISVPIFCFVRIFYFRFHFLFHFLFLLHISILFPVPCFSSCPKFASDAIGLYVVFRRWTPVVAGMENLIVVYKLWVGCHLSSLLWGDYRNLWKSWYMHQEVQVYDRRVYFTGSHWLCNWS